ncbi:MAG: ATP-binding cassette domain-containing protein, partial [Streptomyces sp.]
MTTTLATKPSTGSTPGTGVADARPAMDKAGYAARIDHVSKSFGRPGAEQLVLDDIALDVAPGEFVTLLGASGCGKSTLLNLVAGLDKPSAGSIDVPGGRPSLMFQEHALFPWLTAGRNIELALKLRGV